MIDRISCAVKNAKWNEFFAVLPGDGYDYPECREQKNIPEYETYRDELFVEVNRIFIN